MSKKIWTLIILSTTAVACTIFYYANQPAADLGSVVVHHINKPLATTTPIISPNVSISPTSSMPSEADISGWNTYTNNQYGFSFLYPTDWEIKALNSSLPGFVYGEDFGAFGEMDMAVLANNNHLDLLNYYTKILRGHEYSGSFSQTYDPSIDKIQNFIVANRPALMITSDIFDNTMVRVITSNGDYVIRFEINSQIPADLETLKKILSTFKFTTATSSATTQTPPSQPAQADTSGLTTYRNNEFGFNFSYKTSDEADFSGVDYVDSSSSVVTFDPVAETAFAIYVFRDPGNFHSQMYNSSPGTDGFDDVTYSPVKRQWLVKSEFKIPQCPEEHFSSQNIPYYEFWTGIHAGASVEVYVTNKGIVALAGANFFGGKISFDNPKLIFKVSCN